MTTTATATRRAARASTDARGDRQRVLSYFAGCGRAGATDHEVARAIGMPLDTARARRVELRDAGKVMDSGCRRPTPTGHLATVWMVTGAVTVCGPRTVAPACICGSFATTDVPIHGGQSIRRDCRSCGRFLFFPVWYGHPAETAQ